MKLYLNLVTGEPQTSRFETAEERQLTKDDKTDSLRREIYKEFLTERENTTTNLLAYNRQRAQRKLKVSRRNKLDA
mgnify:CR=1 FL=1|jgi:hypothetical protein